MEDHGTTHIVGSKSTLQDLVTLVTGGASGLGEATVRRFINGGAKAAILDLPSSRGSQIAEELGPNCIFIPGNVQISEQIETCVTTIREKFQRLDVVVNCAGILQKPCNVEDCQGESLKHVQSMFDINAIGTYKVISAAVRLMKENAPGEDGERGVIVNFSSVSATDCSGGFAPYAGTKGAVSSMTLPLARDLAKYGIRVNSIAPGFVETPMTKELMMTPGHTIPSLFPKRPGRKDEVAAMVQHIVENKYMNAAVIRLDAGFRRTNTS